MQVVCDGGERHYWKRGAKFDPGLKVEFYWPMSSFSITLSLKTNGGISLADDYAGYAESWFCTMPGIPKMTMPGIKTMCRPHVEK